MLEYKENGFLQDNFMDHLKHLDITNVIIVKKLGCQLILKKDLDKVAKVAIDNFIQLICGKIFIKRNMVNFRKSLYLITKNHI
jgi:hypothetical protein